MEYKVKKENIVKLEKYLSLKQQKNEQHKLGSGSRQQLDRLGNKRN